MARSVIPADLTAIWDEPKSGPKANRGAPAPSPSLTRAGTPTSDDPKTTYPAANTVPATAKNAMISRLPYKGPSKRRRSVCRLANTGQINDSQTRFAPSNCNPPTARTTPTIPPLLSCSDHE